MANQPLICYFRRYRLRSGLSHGDIAFLLGSVYGENVSKYESGIRFPKLRNLIALEIVLFASARDLYEGVLHQVRRDLGDRIQGLYNHVKRQRRTGRTKRKLQTLELLAKEVGVTLAKTD